VISVRGRTEFANHRQLQTFDQPDYRRVPTAASCVLPKTFFVKMY